ncbi:RNA polymerase [Sea otter poxvirus]|uniref:DNA-directed RNA polymerase 35 kDa subunit n=1 Tax=Sea otter poxvirus TaxID=1416741 RepID=A0A2U9QHU0_9POXV|nr:RNA polymerase [Sea otter poxvirus]AWU47164.1 RNA polymerase [Sea otter poxvirus]
MYRKEISLMVDIPPSLATLIRHGFHDHVKWPALSVVIVLKNDTTSIHEEWRTSIEHMPTRKVFYKYTDTILTRQSTFCVHLKFEQSQSINIITMHDFTYYIITDNKLTKVDKPVQLKETLLHSFQDFRHNNIQNIEIIAFSSGTDINDNLISNLTFLDIETFNREYENTKPALTDEPIWCSPFIVIAPAGRLTFHIETYPWIDTRQHFMTIIDFLEAILLSDIHNHKIKTDTNIDDINNSISSYNTASGMIYVSDLITMSIINFFGGNVRLESFHKINMQQLDTDVFIAALRDAFAMIRRLV